MLHKQNPYPRKSPCIQIFHYCNHNVQLTDIVLICIIINRCESICFYMDWLVPLQCVNTVNKPKTTVVFSWHHFFHLSEHHNPNKHMRRIWGQTNVRIDRDVFPFWPSSSVPLYSGSFYKSRDWWTAVEHLHYTRALIHIHISTEFWCLCLSVPICVCLETCLSCSVSVEKVVKWNARYDLLLFQSRWRRLPQQELQILSLLCLSVFFLHSWCTFFSCCTFWKRLH